MKQFNLEEYLRLKEEGREPKIVTREGTPVRILCTDRNDATFPIVGLFEDGSIYTFTTKGLFNYGADSRDDLFFAPTKHEGWMNIYTVHISGFVDHLSGSRIYTSKEDALKGKGCEEMVIATTKIEWQE